LLNYEQKSESPNNRIAVRPVQHKRSETATTELLHGLQPGTVKKNNNLLGNPSYLGSNYLANEENNSVKSILKKMAF
jgi:hypothetical protein